MRVRAAVVASLLLLAGIHLPSAQGAPAPPPDAHQSVPVPVYGPSSVDSQRALVAAIRAAQADQTARWYQHFAAEPAPAPAKAVTRYVRRNAVTVPAAEAPAYDAGSMEALVCSIFVDSCGRAIRVFTCESHLNPSARNRSGASGIAQIMLPMHADLFEAHGWDWRTDWSDAYKNLVVAYDLSSGGTNFGGWVCR